MQEKNGHYIAWFWSFRLDGTAHGNSIEFACTREDDSVKPCGKATATRSSDEMRGVGKFGDLDVTWTALRATVPTHAPETHDFVPTKFQHQFNGKIEPVLRLNPGDSVRTKCVDAGGKDETSTSRTLGEIR